MKATELSNNKALTKPRKEETLYPDKAITQMLSGKNETMGWTNCELKEPREVLLF